jgi:hypothetical protein
MNSNQRNSRDGTPDDEGPAVTTEAMSADPMPPEQNHEPHPHRDPTEDPSGAARELSEASGGQAVEPDLAEVPERSSPAVAAAHFEVDIGTEAGRGDQNDEA